MQQGETMRTKLFLSVAGVGLLLAAGPAVAHHAFSAEFDAGRPLQLQGKVVKTEWINPHSWIHVEVEDDDGQIVTWAIECGAPNSLMRRGLNKNSIPVGTELVIDGFGAKGRVEHGERARHHIARRVDVLRRIVRHRRAVRAIATVWRSRATNPL